MGIQLGSSFTVNTGLPLDDRFQVVNLVARDAIPNLRRYQGLTVFVIADTKTYVLKTGITNSDWVELGGGSGGGPLSDLSNLSDPTLINQNLTPDFAGTRSIGQLSSGASKHFKNIIAKTFTGPANQTYAFEGDVTVGSNLITNLVGGIPADVTELEYEENLFYAGGLSHSFFPKGTKVLSVGPSTLTMSQNTLALADQSLNFFLTNNFKFKSLNKNSKSDMLTISTGDVSGSVDPSGDVLITTGNNAETGSTEVGDVYIRPGRSRNSFNSKVSILSSNGTSELLVTDDRVQIFGRIKINGPILDALFSNGLPGQALTSDGPNAPKYKSVVPVPTLITLNASVSPFVGFVNADDGYQIRSEHTSLGFSHGINLPQINGRLMYVKVKHTDSAIGASLTGVACSPGDSFLGVLNGGETLVGFSVPTRVYRSDPVLNNWELGEFV